MLLQVEAGRLERGGVMMVKTLVPGKLLGLARMGAVGGSAEGD